MANKIMTNRGVTSPKANITVSKQKIDEATLKSSSHCMIAEAVRERFPGVNGISVDLQTIRWSNPEKGLRYVYLTPRPAQEALVAWDQGIKPKPFTFRLSGAQILSMSRGSPGKQKLAHPSLKKTRRPKRRGNHRVSTDILGGKAPPHSALSTRREFGMKGFQPVQPK